MSVMTRLRVWAVTSARRVLAAAGYEGATRTRRGDGWKSLPGPADAAARWSVALLRERSRHLIRNHWAAKRAAAVLSSKIVGAGIIPSCRESDEYNALLRLWSRPQSQVGSQKGQSLATVQRIVVRTVIESGSCLVVRQYRTRRQMLDRDLVMPFQLAVLEPEFLDTTKDGKRGNNEVVMGVEYDPSGWPVAYWLHTKHPGDALHLVSTASSVRVDAKDVSHVYWQERPGQTIGIPWLAAVLLKIRDFDEYEDAQLIRQKIAAMFAAFVTNSGDSDNFDPDDILTLEPGRVQFLAPGESIDMASPPDVGGYADYSRITIRSIAAGIGLSYEDLSNDYSQTNFSSARMGSLVTRQLLDQWQTEMMIGLLCQSLDVWLAEGADLLGVETAECRWTAPQREMLDPSREVGAQERAIAAGLTSRQEVVRKSGRDVETVDAERKQDSDREEEMGLNSESSDEDGSAVAAMVERTIEETIRELRNS